MKNKIFIKIFSGYVITIVIFAILYMFFSFRIITENYQQNIQEQLKNTAYLLEERVTPFWQTKNYTKLDSLLEDLSLKANARITIILSDGKVVADSDKNPTEMNNHISRAEIAKALDGEIGVSVRYSNTMNQKMFYLAIPVSHEEKFLGVLRVSMYMNWLEAVLISLQKEIVKISLFIFAITLIVAFILAQSMSRPIQVLAVATRKVAKGDYDTKVYLRRNDEIKDVADSFNIMVDSLNKTMSDLRHQKEILNATITFMREGLCIIRKDGIILKSNQRFQKLFPANSDNNMHYWEVIRDKQLSDSIEKGISEQSDSKFKISIADAFYLCSTSFLPNFGHTVIVFHDISEMEKLAQMKKELMLNVSHELKTPLTAIKGFVETLQYETLKPEQKHYLDIIERNTNRLVNIVNDLLLLAAVEQETKIDFKLSNLQKMCQNVATLFADRLADKNITFTVSVDENLPDVYLDDFRIEQILTNLLQNGYQYTDDGQIDLKCYQTTESIVFSVSDTGTGIPEESIPHLFERFYVVDKSRSKKYGGTGLGLSIVKHIVLKHSGSIHVDSQVGKGTEISVYIPKKLEHD
ncbi:MAG: HAMP domain-containing protein [Candidatus Cloacimonetes bacterium]|nr:HAMP domain-containing protein [Candidatus Cloacimonadota bacterium]